MKIKPGIANEETFMEQGAPRFSYPGLADQALVYEALGLIHHDFSTMARIINTGNSFLVLEVENESMLRSLFPKKEMIAELSLRYGLLGFYIFCLPGFAPGIDATTRMFMPVNDMEEECAKGMAAGSLACYLYRFIEKKIVYTIEQGKYTRPISPGLIEVNMIIENNEISSLYTSSSTKTNSRPLKETA